MAVDEVVGAHDRSHAGLFDRGFERGEVDLPQAALVDVDIDGVALEFLVVGHKMLDAGPHALRLDAGDVGHGHPGAQLGVLAVALEVAATLGAIGGD